MQILVGLENGIEGRSLAWALDYPGCFAYGQDETEAVLHFPQALINYQEWVGRHAEQSWLQDLGDFDVRLAEVWQVYRINEHYDLSAEGRQVNAWFRHDWKPLSVLEVRRGLNLLHWTRADLLAVVEGLTPEQLDRQYPGERWSIRGILSHVASGDWWYLDRLGLAPCPRAQLPQDPFECLPFTRAALEATLPDLAGMDKVQGIKGEIWSPRKLLRRAIWHELDHIGHIHRLLLW